VAKGTFVARGLAPVRLRSSRKIGTRDVPDGTASQSNGGKPPRHKAHSPDPSQETDISLNIRSANADHWALA
jgi:hypothetical protein